MKKHINLCNIYVTLWCVFHLKGWLYDADIISVVVYTILMVISLYYTLLYFGDTSKNKFVKAYNTLLIMFVIYGVINIMFFEPVQRWNLVPTDFYLQNVLKSMLPFYAFYGFAKEGKINKKWLCIWSIIFIFIVISRYSISESRRYAKLLLRGKDADEITNNAGYFFSALLPIACFWNKKPVIQYTYFAICFFFIIISMKRGALIVGMASLVFYFYYTFVNSSMKKRMTVSFLMCVFVFLGYLFISQVFKNSEYFQQRVNDTIEGNTSNRTGLYSEFWYMFWNNCNPISFFVGKGADATIRYGENYAHNDWLEILMNQGIVGVLLFVWFWMKFHSFWKSLSAYNSVYIAVGVCFVQMLTKTMFSMSINNIEIYLTCILGYSVALMANRSHLYNKKLI